MSGLFEVDGFFRARRAVIGWSPFGERRNRNVEIGPSTGQIHETMATFKIKDWLVSVNAQQNAVAIEARSAASLTERPDVS